ncbi:MAG: phosphoenolpyruvate synthase [Ardenticatenaceae bacterium]
MTTLLQSKAKSDIKSEDVPYVLPFSAIRARDLPHVGGKGANLGEMSGAGFPVPPGFCVTTSAFRAFMAACEEADALYGALEGLEPNDVEATRVVAQEVRTRLGEVPIPSDVAAAVVAAWQEAGSEEAYAVRSSATAEDLPDASFAGQQDTYLNVRGEAALLEKVRDCWVSLFTDRAILYRAKNGFSHREVFLSVVVQRMVFPEVSGIMFTADPVSGNRQTVSIDASYGLGEALVSGLVSADLYKIDKRTLKSGTRPQSDQIEVQVADKHMAIRPLPEGGTTHEQLTGEARLARVLSDEQVIALAEIGQRIESHYGKPQDIEWCLVGANPSGRPRIYIVQSRPITSLFPLPEPRPTDGTLHVYVSFNHAQVMTDPMPPMAHAIWRLLFPFGKSDPNEYNPYMLSAGGRLYVDPSPMLHLPLPRRAFPKVLEMADKLIADGVREVIKRDEFRQGAAKGATRMSRIGHWLLPLLAQAQARLWKHAPEGATEELSAKIDEYIKEVQARLEAAQPGAERLKVARNILGSVFVEGALPMPPYLAAGFMARLLLSRMTEGYGDPKDIDILVQGLSGNVTTEMGLEVGDLADVARQSPALVEHFRLHDATTALQTAAQVEGGAAFLAAWEGFMTRYGMRGPSEIDISRPRWREDPSSLLQIVVGNLRQEKSGVHRAKHRELLAASEAAGERLVAAAQHGPLGFLRGRIARRLVRVARNQLAIREHPKFLLIRTLGLVKEAILEAAQLLQQAGRIDELDDIWYLDLIELIDVLEQPTEEVRPYSDPVRRIAQRQAQMARYREMSPPRVMTSDGEIPVVKHSGENVPEGALPGNPVSTGIIEGIAKVVLDPTTELLTPGEILIAPFTDPGWTPLFINAAGLVMEVGGLMTHGSVVAREYGIPAVVGVLNATKLIQSGQKIRVNGDLGYVEILE